MFSKRLVTEEIIQKFDRYEEPYFHHTLRFALEKTLPLVRVHLYSYVTEKSEYFYVIRENNAARSNILVHVQGEFNEKDYLLGFEKFIEATGVLSTGKGMTIVGRDIFIQPLAHYLTDSHSSYKITTNPCYEFFVPEEKEGIIMKKSSQLPEGYSMGPSCQKDADFITSKWKFASEGEVDNTIQKITSLPSISLRNVDQKLVAFEMVDVSGSLSHLYVLEEYRSRGLGKMVEEELARKIIGAGITVFKYVEQDNTIVVGSSMRSSYWTARRNADDSYNFMTWMQLIPR